jgi:hypothetical protein
VKAGDLVRLPYYKEHQRNVLVLVLEASERHGNVKILLPDGGIWYLHQKELEVINENR